MPLIDPHVQELLRPSTCYSPQAIQAFLRYSRNRSDDNIHNGLPRTGSCAEYMSTVLFPEWLSRDAILTYCSDVAELKNEPRKTPMETPPDQSDEQASNRPDPRYDPYGARDYGKTATAAEEKIKTWVSTERNVEAIIRQTSVDHLARKCGSFATSPQSFLDSYENSFKQQH